MVADGRRRAPSGLRAGQTPPVPNSDDQAVGELADLTARLRAFAAARS
jgi:hypothetical protein